MQLFGRDLARRVREGQGTGCVTQELDVETTMNGLPRCRVAAHVRHVTGDRDRGNPVFSQPVLKTGLGEATWEVFLEVRIVRSLRHLGMKVPARCSFAEKRFVWLGKRVLNDNRGNPALCGIHHTQDLLEMPGRMRDRQRPGEILILHVNHKKRPVHYYSFVSCQWSVVSCTNALYGVCGRSAAGTTNAWEGATGRHLVTLFAFADVRAGSLEDTWLAYHPEGCYDGLPGVERFLAWRVGNELLTPKTLGPQLHQPERINSALKLEPVSPGSP